MTEGGMTAGFNYYRSLKEDAALVHTFEGENLSMPVLIVTGYYGVGDKLQKSIEKESSSLQSIIVKNSGHFVAEEAPDTFNSSVIKFLDH